MNEHLKYALLIALYLSTFKYIEIHFLKKTKKIIFKSYLNTNLLILF